MTEPTPPLHVVKLDYQPPPQHGGGGRGRTDEIAYVAPMLTFLALVWAGTEWKSIYPAAYVARTILVAALLVYFWKHYTKISWRYWWLGLIVGVVGIFQWIGMQLLLQSQFAHFRPDPESVFNPMTAFSTAAGAWAFIAVRVIGAVLIVPVMEELFWRDYLWRQILAPNDFKLAEVGERDWMPFLIVSGVFGTVHGNWWLTAIVWAMMVGALLIYTKSLGACIIAHATTNLLLAGYVLWTRDWSFW